MLLCYVGVQQGLCPGGEGAIVGIDKGVDPPAMFDCYIDLGHPLNQKLSVLGAFFPIALNYLSALKVVLLLSDRDNDGL